IEAVGMLSFRLTIPTPNAIDREAIDRREVRYEGVLGGRVVVIGEKVNSVREKERVSRICFVRR
ncbi:hypothetical protein HAX54_010079, partial [Datura stramonium]|nr:hypothetical protein [Datura stramonium]